jgi:hypothetical protein
MKLETFKELFDDRLAKDAIINDRHTGHKEDYLIIHCLLKKYHPKTFFEIGTNTGYGTKIIKNALGPASVVYSLDLPSDSYFLSKQHPISEGKGDCVGHECDLPYEQRYGDSTGFPYFKMPCEGYFIDAEHTYESVFIETTEILKATPKIIIWHDADENVVFNAAVNAMKDKPYDLSRVIDTRILYAIRKPINDHGSA